MNECGGTLRGEVAVVGLTLKAAANVARKAQQRNVQELKRDRLVRDGRREGGKETKQGKMLESKDALSLTCRSDTVGRLGKSHFIAVMFCIAVAAESNTPELAT